MRRLAILSLSILTLLGCHTTHTPPTPSSALNHVVLIELQNTTQTEALLLDCNRLLPGIKHVDSYWCGKHFDIGRAGVDQDYDIALCVGFQTQTGYEKYLADPAHIELVDKWKPHFESIRIYDIKDTYQQ